MNGCGVEGVFGIAWLLVVNLGKLWVDCKYLQVLLDDIGWFLVVLYSFGWFLGGFRYFQVVCCFSC